MKNRKLETLYMILANNLDYIESQEAEDFREFWRQRTNVSYVFPERKLYLQQRFPLQLVLPNIRFEIYINIHELVFWINNGQVDFHREKYNPSNMYYTYSKDNFLKQFLMKKEIGRYPIIALFFPANTSDGLKYYQVVEGNHRLTKAGENITNTDILVVDTIVLPQSIFEIRDEWLGYLMISNYYEIVHVNETLRTSYKTLEEYLSIYT